MSFYSWAFNDLDDPYWACIYNVDTHPLYHKCDKCPSFDKCTQPAKFFRVIILPKDCPHDCTNCPKDLHDDCTIWLTDEQKLPPDCVGNCFDCQKYTMVRCPYLNEKPFEPPPEPIPKPTAPMPYQDVTGDQLFDMLLQRIKRFFTRSPPKNNPIPSKRRE